MATALMYCTETCPYCIRADRLLAKRGISVEKVDIDAVPGALARMMELTGRDTVPQIFIGETHVGGYDDLVELDMLGELEALLG